jgi:cyanophycinase
MHVSEAQAPRAASGPATSGTLFIVGGGTQPIPLVQEFVRRAGGDTARIVVFAMASTVGEKSGEETAARFRTMGAHARNVWITREQANTDSVARLLDGATAVWFGGGDQNRLTAVLRGTVTERAIRARFDRGAVIGGTSAGAAVLSTPMITGDELGQRRDSSEAWTRVSRGSVAVDSGFGYLTTAIVDQHFLRRKRHNRLLSLVLAQPPHLGVGIDEGTALIVESSGLWRVEGASSVLIVDAREAQRTADSAAVLGASGAKMHLLPAGSTYDPKAGVARLRR